MILVASLYTWKTSSVCDGTDFANSISVPPVVTNLRKKINNKSPEKKELSYDMTAPTQNYTRLQSEYNDESNPYLTIL